MIFPSLYTAPFFPTRIIVTGPEPRPLGRRLFGAIASSIRGFMPRRQLQKEVDALCGYGILVLLKFIERKWRVCIATEY